MNATRPAFLNKRWLAITAMAVMACGLLALLALGAVPASMMRSMIASELRGAADRPVEIGELSRDSFFSYSPVITVHDLRIGQPAWAGKKDFVKLEAISARVNMFDIIAGQNSLDNVTIDGLDISLVRDKDGRKNWERGGKGDNGLQFADLIVKNARFSFRDEKRDLALAGPIMVNPKKGVRINASGTFLDSKADFRFAGPAVTGNNPDANYPFTFSLRSPALHLTATGKMAGGLNLDRFTASLSARAPTLKNLDKMIEAGLFGTQPIDLDATIRHRNKDWYIDGLNGSVGQSRLAAKASILKRNGRTKIDATVHASRLDFDDLADDQGLARAAAENQRIGPRVLPNTQINLSKMGPTDGQIDFTIDRLVSRRDSIFRSLKGKLTLDHRIINITDLVAGMKSGQLTGSVRLDHRSGAPKLSTDLTLAGASISDLIGDDDIISARMRGRIKLSGSGDTIRTALEKADGKATMVASGGSVRATAAHVLGQNLGGTIEKIIDDPKARVPLRCLVVNFSANNGVLTPSPVAVDTAVSIGRAEGNIMLDGEKISLIMRGGAKGKSALHIVDPIRISGSLNAPSVSVAGLGLARKAQKPSLGDVITVAAKSVGSALGIGKDDKQDAAFIRKPKSLNCDALIANAMQ
ncbi:AsmA family protein [uncultured Parasphingorhabdus sp.]|uniref:AsmA family protein n=1 Tax=uncultured Parasphingorhabdus sp. TaxID=2709694 RepID=UPI0030D825ED|tara:strand:- start:75534 stop:77453 length:1920 start_codon:yes stop_codon:yes gene_type:complete